MRDELADPQRPSYTMTATCTTQRRRNVVNSDLTVNHQRVDKARFGSCCQLINLFGSPSKKKKQEVRVKGVLNRLFAEPTPPSPKMLWRHQHFVMTVYRFIPLKVYEEMQLNSIGPS